MRDMSHQISLYRLQLVLLFTKKGKPYKPDSVVPHLRRGISIIYLGLPSLAGSSGLPVAVSVPPKTGWSGDEQPPGVRNLFDLSTPGVYRDACHHTKPWALTPRFHPYHAVGVTVYFLWHFPYRALRRDPSR